MTWINLPSQQPNQYKDKTIEELEKLIQEEISFMDADFVKIEKMQYEINNRKKTKQ